MQVARLHGARVSVSRRGDAGSRADEGARARSRGAVRLRHPLVERGRHRQRPDRCTTGAGPRVRRVSRAARGVASACDRPGDRLRPLRFLRGGNPNVCRRCASRHSPQDGRCGSTSPAERCLVGCQALSDATALCSSRWARPLLGGFGASSRAPAWRLSVCGPIGFRDPRGRDRRARRASSPRSPGLPHRLEAARSLGATALEANGGQEVAAIREATAGHGSTWHSTPPANPRPSRPHRRRQARASDPGRMCVLP